MQLVTRTQYEQRTYDFAWAAIKKSPWFWLAALVIGCANFAGYSITGANSLAGMGFAFAMPMLVSGLGIAFGAHNEHGAPSVPIALMGQFAMLCVMYISIALWA